MTKQDKTQEYALEKLFDMAQEQFGYDEEKVRSSLKAYGRTVFRRDEFSTYIELLRRQFIHEQDLLSYPDRCPICSAPIERDKSRDRQYGARLGWRCTVDRYHFMEARWSFLQRNTDDPTVV